MFPLISAILEMSYENNYNFTKFNQNDLEVHSGAVQKCCKRYMKVTWLLSFGGDMGQMVL